MKKSIFILVSIQLLLLSTNIFASPLPKEWYFSPVQDNAFTQTQEDKSYDLDNTLDTIISTNSENAGKVDKKNARGWQLDEIVTTLALTLQGKIGIKSWGGKKAIELSWKKRSRTNADENDDFKAGTVNFQGIQKITDVEKIFGQLAKGLVAKGKVRDEKLLKRNLIKKALLFQQMIKGIEASEVSSWTPYKMRLELTVAADATVSMALASAGGEIRMRFEWRRSFNESKEKNTLGKVAEGSRQLMNNLAEEIANAIEEEPASKKVMIENFNVSIGISLSGNVGIAEASGEMLTKVSFKPSDEKEEGLKDLRSFAKSKVSSEIPFLRNNNEKSLGQVTFINSDKVRKGFKKAVRFAEYFQKKLAKSKYKKSDWAVETISPSFSFGLGGDIGLATLEGTSELELEYHNANF